MRLLLDTHSFLWYIEDDDRLSQTAEQTISDIDNEVLLSIGSLWEIAIKESLIKCFVALFCWLICFHYFVMILVINAEES